MSTPLPSTPAVEVVVSRQDVLLPAAAAELLRRGTCSIPEAGEFLGFAAKADGSASSAVYGMADRYRRRTQALMFDERGNPRPYDPRDLIPRMRNGRWTEVPNSGTGHVYRVDTRLLVPMVFKELGWPM